MNIRNYFIPNDISTRIIANVLNEYSEIRNIKLKKQFQNDRQIRFFLNEFADFDDDS